MEWVIGIDWNPHFRRQRWTAAERVIDLVTPGASSPGSGALGATWRSAPVFAGDGYVLLDAHGVRPKDSRHDNAAALLAGLEHPARETFAGLVAALHRRLRAPEASRGDGGVGNLASETAVGVEVEGARHGGGDADGRL